MQHVLENIGGIWDIVENDVILQERRIGMELRQLKYFLAVADARSFVSAADTLFISRQAISKSVAQLEQELNVELFMRDSGGAFLTPAGMMFYERVRSLVMELDSVRSQMQSYGKRYQQRLNIAFSIGRYDR